MISPQNGSTQTTPFDFVREENSIAVVSLGLMLDDLLGDTCSTAADNTTASPNFVGRKNTENLEGNSN